MQRKTVVLVALLAAVALVALTGVDAGYRLTKPKDMEESIEGACNSTCTRSCNSTFNAFNAWFRDMKKDDAKECDVCAVTYYAQDFLVDVGKCSCKVLEQFRKVSMDTQIAEEEECAECCLDWALDTIAYEEDCKDPEKMRPDDAEKDEETGAYRNACGFTIKTKASEEEEEKEEDKEDKDDSDSYDYSNLTKKKKKSSSKDDDDDDDDEDAAEGNFYDYDSLGSQFDTCKCICKGLPPCKAPSQNGEDEEDEDKKFETAASFFDSAAFSGPIDEQSILAALLP